MTKALPEQPVGTINKFGCQWTIFEYKSSKRIAKSTQEELHQVKSDKVEEVKVEDQITLRQQGHKLTYIL